ncbi:beta family protein [Corallococcus sp. EGB]|uniref:beta family protein n=1 Tax=Corallococcus sp. EGB TaxID=1521117 RepID=UPI001CBED6E6|nr:beta family protein [Corallococcus sp. EGB]
MPVSQAFGSSHYVPILKGKKGEFDALKNLFPNDLALLTPVIEVPAVDWDWDNDVPRKPESVHVATVVDNIFKSWGGQRPLYVDVSTAALTTPLVGDAQARDPYSFFFDAARNKGLLAIPVVALSPDATTLAAVKSAVAKDNLGVMVRVGIDQIRSPTLYASLTSIPQLLGIPVTQIDLLLDLEEVPETAVMGLTMGLPQWIAGLPHLASWRTLSLAGSGFPKTLAGLMSGQLMTTPRSEWVLWTGIVQHLLAMKTRVPTFSDYGITFHDSPEVDPRVMRPSQNIRYTISNEWLVIKGLVLRTGVGMPPHQLCQAVRSHTAFCGPAFSHGDNHIDRCAQQLTGPGNLTTWREMGTNHHLTFVVRQIASQTALSVPVVPGPVAGQAQGIP